MWEDTLMVCDCSPTCLGPHGRLLNSSVTHFTAQCYMRNYLSTVDNVAIPSRSCYTENGLNLNYGR
jgi:hypothetical protein